MVMSDLYETNYGIYDHVRPTVPRPLASVAMHPAEDINEGSLLEAAIRTFIELDIGNQAKISFLEYLELPRDIALMVLEACRAKSKKTDSTISNIEKHLKNPLQ